MLAIVLGHGHGMRAGIGALYVAAATIPLWRTDVASLRLPNAIVLPGWAFAFTGVVGSALATDAQGREALAGAAGPALFCVGAFALVHAAGGVGMGDVKLVILLALALVPLAGAPLRLVLCFGGAVLAAGAVAWAALLHPAASRVATLPFGPSLLGAFWLAAAAE